MRQPLPLVPGALQLSVELLQLAALMPVESRPVALRRRLPPLLIHRSCRSITKAHSWYSNSLATEASKLYVTFQDSAEISIGDKIYVTESDAAWTVGTQIAVNPAIQALAGVPSTTTLMANAQASGGAAGALFVVITVGAAPIPANTLVRLAVTVMANPANVAAAGGEPAIGDLSIAATGGVWVRTTKSGFRNGDAPAAPAMITAAACDNFCTPFMAPTASVDSTGNIFDAGAQIYGQVNGANPLVKVALAALTPTQTTPTPGAANTLTLLFTTGDTELTGVGHFVYVNFPAEYAASLASTVAGVSLTACTSAASCTSTTNLLSGNQVSFVDTVRLQLPILTGVTLNLATTYKLTVPLTNPTSPGSYTFAMSSTTDGLGTAGAATGFPAAFISTALVVNSGSVVSAVTGSFANNTPGATAANTLTVSFQDAAALPSGSKITVVLPSQFTSSVVAASPTVSGTGVTVSGASSFSSLTLTVTTASEIAAATSVSLFIPLLSSPVGGSYTIMVATSMSPALVSTTSPHAQIGGTISNFSVTKAGAVLSVAFENSLAMAVGETIMVKFQTFTTATGAVATQASTATTPCNMAAADLSAGATSVITAIALTSGWGTTGIVNSSTVGASVDTGSCIGDTTTPSIATLSFVTTSAAVAANTLVTFTITTAGLTTAPTISYDVALSTISANKYTDATIAHFSVDTETTMATLVPSLSVSTPGAAATLTLPHTTGALAADRYNLYMPGFGASIVANPFVTDGTSASWDETSEVLTLTKSGSSALITVAVAALPAAGSYKLHGWSTEGQTLTSGVTPLLISDTVTSDVTFTSSAGAVGSIVGGQAVSVRGAPCCW
jgi:hypothetical protein